MSLDKGENKVEGEIWTQAYTYGGLLAKIGTVLSQAKKPSETRSLF